MPVSISYLAQITSRALHPHGSIQGLWARFLVIQPLIDMEKRTEQAVLDVVNTTKANLTTEQRQVSWYRVSKSTVYDWIKRYEDSG